jgi:hypothetical protein
MKINSKREYQIVYMMYGTEGIEPITTLSLNQILADGTSELGNSLHEILDEVLDLEVYQSMYFKPHRDVGQSKGILLRIN